MNVTIPENTEADWLEKRAACAVECAKILGEKKLRPQDVIGVLATLIIGLADHTGKPKEILISEIRRATIFQNRPS